jgi:hypothetical protein
MHLKEDWNPPIQLSLNIRESNYKKVKACRKKFQIMWDMQVSLSRLWMLVGNGESLVIVE